MEVHDLVFIPKPNNKQVHLLAFHSAFDVPKSKHWFIIWERFCQIGNKFNPDIRYGKIPGACKVNG